MKAHQRTPDYDLAVVGAGPGGSAAALAGARAGLRVLILEPQPQDADKPCGEGILPAGVEALQALGVSLEGLPLERIRYVLRGGRTLDIEFPRAGCALDRPTLMRTLAGALREAPEVTRSAQRAECQRESDAGGFRIRTRAGSWSARTLVAADGLLGSCAGWLRTARPSPRRFGLRARFALECPRDRVEVHLGRECEVYLTPLPGARVNVAVLRDCLPDGGHGAQALLERALAQHPLARTGLGALVQRPELRVLSRGMPRTPAEAGAFLVGDAAGGVDPVLGCGVALALTSGVLAGRAAALVCAAGSGAPERDYRRALARETALRRRLAQGLLFLAAHPRLQGAVAWSLDRSPGLGRRLALAVAGSPP